MAGPSTAFFALSFVFSFALFVLSNPFSALSFEHDLRILFIKDIDLRTADDLIQKYVVYVISRLRRGQSRRFPSLKIYSVLDFQF